ncbi:MAG: archaellin/type IV pilin N-terminal domain-containing protein [Candidatus Pacearchaeota archaeon]
MITNKKGLSTVVTTLILILLVLVAIGIVWVVVRGLIGTTESQIDIQKKCIGIDLEITSASCIQDVGLTTYTCRAKVGKSGGETPSGILASFSDATQTVGSGRITTGISLTNNIQATGVTANPNKITVAAYFTDPNDATKESFCSQTVDSRVPYP